MGTLSVPAYGSVVYRLLTWLRFRSEAEGRDLTRPGDRHRFIVPTGRHRYSVGGYPVTPWVPLRARGAFEPVNDRSMPGYPGRFA